MDGALGTMSHSYFKCLVGESLLGTLSHYCFGTWRHNITLWSGLPDFRGRLPAWLEADFHEFATLVLDLFLRDVAHVMASGLLPKLTAKLNSISLSSLL